MKILIKASLCSSMATVLDRSLPSDIISDIMSRLPLEDIIRCSSVSTDWYRITKNLRSDHMHNTKSQVFDVLLSQTRDMSLDFVGVNGCLHMISSNSRRIDGKYKHVEIPLENEPVGRVIGSCNGLLCIAHSTGSPYPYAIYNPITKETMMLPELELHPQCDKLPYAVLSGFGYDPINKKYKVVVAYKYRCYIDERRFVLVATGDIITLGESSWRRLEFPEEVIDTYHPAVFINGAFHWLNGMQHHWEYSHKSTYQLDGILTLDISTEKFNLNKFSAFMDLDVSRLRVLNIGNSLALAGEKLVMESWSRGDIPEAVPTQVWKLLGTKADGSCLYQYMALNVGEGIKRLLSSRHFRTLVIGVLGNGNFLFKASEYGLKDWRLHQLVLYDTEKNACSILDVPAEVPDVWDATIFQPSLVSPPSLRKYSH